MFVGESIINEVSEKLSYKDPEELRTINFYLMDGTSRTHHLQWLGNDFTGTPMAEQLRVKAKDDQMRLDAWNLI